jgi:acetolactate synthase-1/2/3 large subunit
MVALTASRKPLIVVGGGYHWAGGGAEVQAFAEQFGVPIATTFNGKGAVDESSEYSIGTVGAKGVPSANATAEAADFVLWLGSKGGDKSTEYGRLPAPSATVVQVDIDPSALGRTFEVDLGVQADAKAFIEDLSTAAAEHHYRAPRWWKLSAPSDKTPVWGGESIVRCLQTLVDENVNFIADASRVSSWVGAGLKVHRVGRVVSAPRGSGSLGYAIPAAIGACIASPGSNAVAVVGDGAVAMSIHELATLQRFKLSVLVVVVADGELGLLNQVGRAQLDPSFELQGGPSADWSAVAKGYGVDGVTVEDQKSFLESLQDWRERGGPMLINARVPAGEVSPDLLMFKAGGAKRW